MQDEIAPTPRGLLRCLEALADEAACLDMGRTTRAIVDAIETCQRESSKIGHARRPAVPIRLLH